MNVLRLLAFLVLVGQGAAACSRPSPQDLLPPARETGQGESLSAAVRVASQPTDQSAGRGPGAPGQTARKGPGAPDQTGGREHAAPAPAPVAIQSGHVTLLTPPADRGRPELARLAADLDRAATIMARRVPLALDRPITVAVEPDYVALARRTGEVAAAVLAEGGGAADLADLYVVYHPDDLFACEHVVARLLIGRAGLAGRLPPRLESGAALWLSEQWYGRRYADWLPWLEESGALPEPDELVAGGRSEGRAGGRAGTGGGDRPPRRGAGGPASLVTPAAAAVIAWFPGSTLAAKVAAAEARGLPSHLDPAGLRAAVRAAAGSAGSASRPEGAVAARSDAPRRAPFLRGISLAMANSLEGGYHAPALDAQLERLARLGADAVSLMPFAFQRGPDQPELFMPGSRPEGETDAGLVHAVRRARARGFHVLYKPHIWIGGGSWPGDVAMRSEADWQLWWGAYRRFILHHALLARWAGADLFSVGCELSLTLDRAEDWQRLIAGVRAVFAGALTYSGNWNGDLERVRFWDRLDLIGIDAYFPLAASAAAGPGELRRGAAALVQRFAAAARSHGKLVLLTEVGFAARRAAWMQPHVEGGIFSQEDQAASYRALLTSLGRPPWLGGTFIWKAFSHDSARHRIEADFRFLGRQAEAVIADYYKASKPPGTPGGAQ